MTIINRCLNELASVSEKEQILIFKNYESKYSSNIINKLKGILVDSHPFLSFELLNHISNFNLKQNDAYNDMKSIKDFTSKALSVRNSAKNLPLQKLVIFCQPKSGSTFLTNIIAQSLNLKQQNLNSFAYSPTKFGINGREQELCELAILKAISRSTDKNGLVAQHHTHANIYLINQINYYDIKPIILTRNIFDSIISLDDFILKQHTFFKKINLNTFFIDGHNKIPNNFITFPFEKRIDLLTKIVGPWYVNFYLSWKRMESHVEEGICWLTYENSILNKTNLINKLSTYIKIQDNQKLKLAQTFHDPKGMTTLFNKGITGRGNAININTKKFLIDYATNFSEFNKNDFKNMFYLDS